MSDPKRIAKTSIALTAGRLIAIANGIFAAHSCSLRARGRGASFPRRAGACLALLAGLLIAAPGAQAAEFGLNSLSTTFTDSSGTPSLQAGSHPFAFTTYVAANTEELESGKVVPVEEPKDIVASLPAGLIGAQTAVPRCSAAEFLAGDGSGECADSTVVGVANVEYGNGGGAATAKEPIFNLLPSPGEPAKLGFIVENRAPVILDVGVNPAPPYNLIVTSANITQTFFFLNATLTVWGVPAAEAHDPERGGHVVIAEKPFLTLPTRCAGPLRTTFQADSWLSPGPPYPFSQTIETQDEFGQPLPVSGCEKLGFSPTIAAQPSSRAASSPTGLDFSLDDENPGLTNPNEGAAADSTIEKAVVTLPQGMSVNPSQAEGLAVCSRAQLRSETPFSAPGEGCPEASKIGSAEVESPLVEEHLKGTLYVATPYENEAQNSLIALYMVIKSSTLGVIFRQPLRVQPDPQTGQLITTAEEIPQWPFSHFQAALPRRCPEPARHPAGLWLLSG